MRGQFEIRGHHLHHHRVEDNDDDVWDDSNQILSLDWPVEDAGEDDTCSALDDQEWMIPRHYLSTNNSNNSYARGVRGKQNPFTKLKPALLLETPFHHNEQQQQQQHSTIGKVHINYSRLSDSSTELCPSFSSLSSRSSPSTTKWCISKAQRRIPQATLRKKKYLDDEPSITSKDDGNDLFKVFDRTSSAKILNSKQKGCHGANLEGDLGAAACPELDIYANVVDQENIVGNSTFYDDKGGACDERHNFSRSSGRNKMPNGGAGAIYPTQERRICKKADEHERKSATSSSEASTLPLPPTFIFLADQALDGDSSSCSDTTSLSSSTSTVNVTSTTTSSMTPRSELTWSKNDEDAVRNRSDWIVVVVTGWSDHDIAETYHLHKFVVGYGPRASSFFRNEFTRAIGNRSMGPAGGDVEASSHSIIEMDTLTASTFPDLLDFIYSLQVPSEHSPFHHMDPEWRSALGNLGKRLGVKGLCDAMDDIP